MNRKTIKYMITSLALVSSLLTISTITMADTISYSNIDLNSSTDYVHNDDKEKNKDNEEGKHKYFDLFSKENSKYLSADQKKELQKLKKFKDKDEKLSKEQVETLHSLIDCIIKGKLGDEKYKDFKCLTEKKKGNEKLTEEECKKFKEYRDIIDGSKLSTKDILSQFLR